MDNTYLGGFNFSPDNYLRPGGQSGSLTDNMSGYMSQSQNYADQIQKMGQLQMQQAMQGANYGRQSLIGQIGGAGQSRSMMMGGAGAGNLQRFDQGTGQQIGQIGAGMNQQLGQLQMDQGQTVADMRNKAMQQQMYQAMNTPGFGDYLGIGIKGVNSFMSNGGGAALAAM